MNGKEKSYTGIETGFSRNCLFNVQGFIILGMSYDMSLYVIVVNNDAMHTSPKSLAGPKSIHSGSEFLIKLQENWDRQIGEYRFF